MTAHLFGEHLKREREMRGVSLEEISAATRISVRFLEALENEQWERLPGGIFNRGFIRSVAHFLGLDEEGLIAEYALETHERPEIAVWTKEPVQPRPNWAAIISVIIIIVIALAGGGWFVHQRYGAAISAWHQQHPFIKTVLARIHRERSTSAGKANGGADAASQLETPRQSSNPSQVPPDLAAPGTAANRVQTAGGQVTNPVPPDTATARTGSSKAASQIPMGGPLELKIEAGETSNVTVIADGKPVFSGRLDAQRTLQFKAQRGFTVTSSNSNAVLLELNGNTVPPLGPPGQPGKITLTRENLKAGPGDGN
jgi:cytoskeleton protein RodZ